MGGRDRTAVLLKEAMGWSYTKALGIVRRDREEILKIQKEDGTTFPEAAFKLMLQKYGDPEGDEGPQGSRLEAALEDADDADPIDPVTGPD